METIARPQAPYGFPSVKRKEGNKSRKGYVALATYGRVAPILRTNRVIECNVKCCFNM